MTVNSELSQLDSFHSSNQPQDGGVEGKDPIGQDVASLRFTGNQRKEKREEEGRGLQGKRVRSSRDKRRDEDSRGRRVRAAEGGG